MLTPAGRSALHHRLLGRERSTSRAESVAGGRAVQVEPEALVVDALGVATRGILVGRQHAPAEVALGWLIALSASWAIAVDDAGVFEAWTRLGVTVAIAIPLVFGASILRAAGAVSTATRWLTEMSHNDNTH